MKKALILGLMALTATFASAMATSWTTTGAPSEASITVRKGGPAVSSIVSTSVVMAITIPTGYTNPTATDTVLKLGLWKCGFTSLTITTAGAIEVTASDNRSAITGKTSVGIVAGQTYVLSAIFTHDSTTGAQTADYYVNNTLVATGVHTTANGISLSDYESSTYTVKDMSWYDGVLTADDIAALVKAGSSNYANVPEPTVLALLALGVAGLALKRRV